MNTSYKVLGAALATLLMASPMLVLAATPKPTKSVQHVEGSRDLATYEHAAMAEVQQMPMTSLLDWQALDGSSLVVWTSNDKPWLLTMNRDCPGLTQASELKLSASAGMVTTHTDAVEIGNERCSISKIQPVDYKKVAHMHQHPMHEHKVAQAPAGKH